MEENFKKTPSHRLFSMLGADVYLVNRVRARLRKVDPDSNEHAGLMADTDSLTHSKKPYAALWAGATIIQYGTDFERKIEAAKQMLIVAPEAAKVTTRLLAKPEEYNNRKIHGSNEFLDNDPAPYSLRSSVPSALNEAVKFLTPYSEGTATDERLSRAEATELQLQATNMIRKIQPKPVSTMPPKPPGNFKP